MAIDELSDGLSLGVSNFVAENPVLTAIGAGVAGAGVGLAVGSLIGGSSKSKTRKSRKGVRRDRRFISKEKSERAYQRRRKKLGKKTYAELFKT